MIYIDNISTNPYFNLALEQYLFENFTDDVFMLWINEPTVVVGKYQNTIEEINQEFIFKNNINVIRRITGGGAVYHDLGNLNYTIISNTDSDIINFKKFTKPVIDLLQKKGINAISNGRNDITINNKKICGNAQHIKNGRVLHHGCILFDVNLENLVNALSVSADKIESKGLKSVRSRVDNVLNNLEDKIDIFEFKDELLQFMKDEIEIMNEYKLSDKDLKHINEIMEYKKKWEWNFGNSPKCNIKNSKRYNAGKIEVLLNIEKGLISNIKFYGDFFSNGNIDELEKRFLNIKYDIVTLSEFLDNLNIECYFPNFSKNEILEVLI